MTCTQKQRIEYLRGKGESFSNIGNALGISENTVKSYCRRNNIVPKATTGRKKPAATHCANCAAPLTHTPGAKKKRFCSDACRMAWWSAHPGAINRKAVYEYICPTCGEKFKAYGNAKRKFCSRACFGLSRRASDV